MVFDLRSNQGGSQVLAWPLLKALRDHRLNQPGGIIVLIGSVTFSSGKGNALDLRDWTDATLMGSPTQQRPNSFGEIRSFRSPNNKLVVQYSTKYFVRGAEEEDAVRPDVTVTETIADWKQGIDTVLEAALRYQPRQ